MNTVSVEILKDLYYMGVNDRETHLFENMWPLPEGVAYNSYLITDEKTALLDTVKITKVDAIKEKTIKELKDIPQEFTSLLTKYDACIDDLSRKSGVYRLYPKITVIMEQ